MAEFAKCHICRALMVDDPDDRREHLGDHANTKRRIDALGRSNAQYLTEIAGLRDQVKGYGQQLEQHPISAEPETITVNEMPDEEIGQFEDADADATYGFTLPDGTTEAYAVAADLAFAPAIDRPDEPVQDAISNLYTPRNLI